MEFAADLLEAETGLSAEKRVAIKTAKRAGVLGVGSLSVLAFSSILRIFKGGSPTPGQILGKGGDGPTAQVSNWAGLIGFVGMAVGILHLIVSLVAHGKHVLARRGYTRVQVAEKMEVYVLFILPRPMLLTGGA